MLDEDGNIQLAFRDGPTMSLGARIASNVAQVVDALEVSVNGGLDYDEAGMRLYFAAKAYNDAIQAL